MLKNIIYMENPKAQYPQISDNKYQWRIKALNKRDSTPGVFIKSIPCINYEQ